MATIVIILAFVVGVVPVSRLAEEPTDGRTVQLRGFAYKSPDGNWVLSDDPQLKSCCAGSRAKSRQQVLLKGEFYSLPSAQALTVEGNLHKHPEEDSIGYYTLENTKIIDTPSLPWKSLAFIFIIGAVTFWVARNKIKK